MKFLLILKESFKLNRIHNIREKRGGSLIMKQSVNIQDQFLNQLRKDGTNCTVFLLNGFQIRGQIKGFDSFTVLFECEGKQQLVYKHAISTFAPQRNVQIDLEAPQQNK
jgi:host factor-I protein